MRHKPNGTGTAGRRQPRGELVHSLVAGWLERPPFPRWRPVPGDLGSGGAGVWVCSVTHRLGGWSAGPVGPELSRWAGGACVPAPILAHWLCWAHYHPAFLLPPDMPLASGQSHLSSLPRLPACQPCVFGARRGAVWPFCFPPGPPVSHGRSNPWNHPLHCGEALGALGSGLCLVVRSQAWAGELIHPPCQVVPRTHNSHGPGAGHSLQRVTSLSHMRQGGSGMEPTLRRPRSS